MIDNSTFIAIFAIVLVMILSIIVTYKIIQHRWFRRKYDKLEEETRILKNKIEMSDVRALGETLKDGLAQLRQTQNQANEVTKHLKEARWK
jgi:hypothetical protein